MTKIIIFVTLAIVNLAVQAQDHKKLFIAENGMEVSDIDSAIVIREMYFPAEGRLVRFEDYYKSTGNIKLKGWGYYVKNILKFHGYLVMYNEQGIKNQEITYMHGEIHGPILAYYSNGKLHKKYELLKSFKHWEFDRTAAVENGIPNYGYEIRKLYWLADDSGKNLIEDGTGFSKENVSYLGEVFVEEGNYWKGFRSGWWLGKTKDGVKSYEDYYVKGNFKRGRWLDGTSQKRYKELFTGPNYKYGNNHNTHFYLVDSGFYKNYTHAKKGVYHISDHYIVATLTIDEKGKVINVSYDRAINENSGKEISRALLNMPKWKPGTLRGKKVTTIYPCAIPIFKSME